MSARCSAGSPYVRVRPYARSHTKDLCSRLWFETLLSLSLSLTQHITCMLNRQTEYSQRVVHNVGVTRSRLFNRSSMAPSIVDLFHELLAGNLINRI